MNLITLENKSIKKACSEKFSHRLCVLVTKYRSNQSFQKNVVATAKYVYLATIIKESLWIISFFTNSSVPDVTKEIINVFKIINHKWSSTIPNQTSKFKAFFYSLKFKNLQ